ncbi:MAG: hypothetical protein EA416_00465, partial [Trueperaceae bacterium]
MAAPSALTVPERARAAAPSAIGRDFDLSRVDRLADLPDALPLADHASRLPYRQCVEAGEPNVLGDGPRLRLASVWNRSFFTIPLDALPTHVERLARESAGR